MRFLVVGCGFAGAVAARELADRGHKVLVVEKREHIAGNAYDELDEHDVLIHRYGPHIFHTNSVRILRWLSRFTDWRFYEHEVKASVDGELYDFPINKETLNRVHGDVDIKQVQVPHANPKNSREAAEARVGQVMTDMFFAGYTEKMWGRRLEDLAPQVANRIPVREDYDTRYFSDTYQFIPRQGYTRLFDEMLDHKNITVELGVAFDRLLTAGKDGVVYTGPIDEYFGYSLGRLPYRSMRFHFTHVVDAELPHYATTNFCDAETPYTRVTDFTRITGQRMRGTTLCYEEPCADGDPYYPVPCQEARELYTKYSALARSERGVKFIGRLAEYQYYNMDQVVGAAIAGVKQWLD